MNKLQKNESGIAHIAAIVVVVVIMAVGFVGWKVWDNRSDSKSTRPSSNQSSSKVAEEETTNDNDSDDPAPAPTSDEQVIAAVKAYCNASVDPATKQPLVLTVGTAGASQKQVLYSADKNFAYVNAVCSKDGTTEGSGSAYYLKKVNDTWVFLYRGQMVSQEYTEQFDIPSEFN